MFNVRISKEEIEELIELENEVVIREEGIDRLLKDIKESGSIPRPRAQAALVRMRKELVEKETRLKYLRSLDNEGE